MFNTAQMMIEEQKSNNSTETAILPMQCYVLPKGFPVEEVLNYVMKDVDKNTFDLGVEKGSFQFLYDNKRNYLVHNYFNGDLLRFSITMTEIFRPYNKDTLRLSDLRKYINELKGKITRSKRYNGNPIKMQEMISDYNYFVSEFKEKSKPIRKLINKYLKT